MIASVDTETYIFNEETREWKPILDPSKAIMFSFMPEDGKQYTTMNKEDFWQHILKTALKLREEPLKIYAHFHEYDFLGYAPWQDTTYKWEFCSTTPFIVKLYLEHNEIWFLDTMAFYRHGLATMKEALNLDNTKMEMPQSIPDLLLESTLKPYLEIDTKIVLEFMLKNRNLIEKIGMRPRQLITIGQIAGNYMLNNLKKDPNASDWLVKGIKVPLIGEFIHPSLAASDIIIRSLRLGRVEAFKTGLHRDIRHIDMNSMFSWAATEIPIPKLKSEWILYDAPLQVLDSIGVSQVIMIVPNCNIGILPVRIPGSEEEYYPTKEGTIILGTYTHQEINYALANGYQLMEILQTVIYEKSTNENPFRNYVKRIYDERLKYEKGTFENWFYKQILNHGWGKMAQHRDMITMKLDDMNLAEQYKAEGYDVVDRNGHINTYVKKLPFRMNAKYAPILYTYITSLARLYHTQALKSLSYSSLLYCDTDSIIYQPMLTKTENFKYSNNIGEWSLVGNYEELLIYGKKAYGNKDFQRLSAIPQKAVNYNDFLKGEIHYKQMSHLSQKDFFNAGTMADRTLNLQDVTKKHNDTQKLLSEQRIFIDALDLAAKPDLVERAIKYAGKSV